MIELNKIYNEDCLTGMKNIPDKSIDMILCDLPYGSTKCKWDIIIPFDKLWEAYNRIVKTNGVILLFGNEPFSSYLRMSNIKNYRYDWYWIKNKPSGALFAKVKPMKAVENICVFYDKRPRYIPEMIKRTETELKRFAKIQVVTSGTDLIKKKWSKSPSRTHNQFKYPNNVLNFKTVFNRDKQKTKHPTQKPVEMFEYLIRTYTTEGNLILDNCIGSGTTAIACINTKRNYIGFELDKTYFDIANKRIEEHKQIPIQGNLLL